MSNSKHRHITYFLIKSLLLLLLVFITSNYCKAQNMPVPENIQAALLPKVLKFNSKISQQANIKMIIVFNSNSQIIKDKFVKELYKEQQRNSCF